LIYIAIYKEVAAKGLVLNTCPNSVRIGLLQDKEDIQDAAAFGYIPKAK
jgi:hypothetical protein